MQKLTLLVTSIDELKSDMSNSASHKHEYKNNFVNKSYDSVHLSLDWAKVQLIVPKFECLPSSIYLTQIGQDLQT